MGLAAILLSVGKFILYLILFLLLLILLLLALPFRIKLKGGYADNQADFDYTLHYAWIIPLKPLLEKKLGRSPGDSQKEEQLTFDYQQEFEIESEKASDFAAKLEEDAAIELKAQPQEEIQEEIQEEEITEQVEAFEESDLRVEIPERIYQQDFAPDQPLKESEDFNYDELINGFNSEEKTEKQGLFSAENKALVKKVWQSKDLIIQALIEFLKLFHFKPLRLEGNFGLEDPADTAFLFAGLYASLPLLPFIQMRLNPYFAESKTDVQISFRSTFSILQILLAFVYNFYLRRLLFFAYRTYREWNQKELETAF